MTELAFAGDGQPASFATDFSPLALLHWFGAARGRMAHGTPGVALGACPRCKGPLVKSSREPLALPCPHCKTPVQGTVVDLLVDQWPEPWAKVDGGGLTLEYRLAVVDDATGVTAGCAACGLATPSNDPATRCRRCNAVVWVERGATPTSTARRMQLGVRVDGTRGDRPYNALVPIVEGERMLRGDAALGASSESGKSLLGITGVGCAIGIALFCVPIVIAIVFALRK